MFKTFDGVGNWARAGAFAATVAIAGLGFTAPAAAADVFVFSATPVGQIGSNLKAGRQMGNLASDPDTVFNMSPFAVTAREGTGPGDGATFSFLAFCVDFFTPLPMDWHAPVNEIDKQYQDQALASDEAKVYSLVNFGSNMWLNEGHDLALYIKLAAVQGAIWQVQTHQVIEFDTFDGYGSVAANQLIQDYVLLPASAVSPDTIRTLFTRDNTAQGLAYAVQTAVPEPAAWTMMIGGFFLGGAMLRRARRGAPSAAH